MDAEADLMEVSAPGSGLRIGVTGHRTLPEDSRLREQVDRAIRRIRALAPADGALTVVSPLAEGADRLVAREVLKLDGAQLEVPLPLPRDEYLKDFPSEGSRGEFLSLLGRATRVITLPPAASRDEAYEEAGRYIVSHSNALIALWDGQPSRGQGGTAEIVELARRRKLPLIWIETEAPFAMSEDLGEGAGSERPSG